MLTLLLASAAVVVGSPAHARILQAHISHVDSAVATLDDVHVRLDWPAEADRGQLTLLARAVDATDLGYHYRDLRWLCTLRRSGAGRWRCDGDVRTAHGASTRLAVDFGPDATDASLSRAGSSLAIHRRAKTPDDTDVDLTRVPLVWAQALLARAWEAGKLKSGTLDGRLRVHAPKDRPLQVAGSLAVGQAAFDTPDATIAGEKLSGRFDIDYRKTPRLTTIVVDGPLLSGDFLVGNAYVALGASPVDVHIEGNQQGGGGWRLPTIAWRDGQTLVATGSAAFGVDTTLQALDVHLHSGDVAPLPKRYLSGWLAVAGLGDLQLSGGVDADARVEGGQLASASATLANVGLVDPKGRFRFDGLNGTPRFSATTPVSGALQWRGGQIYGLDFAAATLPIESSDGALQLRNAVTVPALGGSLRFDGLTLRPPAGTAGTDIRFGLTLDRLDIGQLAKTLHWPAFQGQLSGRIPNARYANDRLEFDGGLTMQLFGGSVQASSLAMDRPFGVAPSLNADLVLDNIDLKSLTGVFDFGSITGRLAGRINSLHLVDWTATAFDAELHTVQARGVKQRISQRAVQNISSVGDASFTSTLQSRLIGLFKDFGYRRIGISCVLANEVCAMGGLHPAARSGPVAGGSGPGFTIVDGAGIPHLTVVGFNRSVDWPTLVERLSAVSKGDVKPVVQ